MRTLPQLIAACGLAIATSQSALAIDCPTGGCPLPRFAPPILLPSVPAEPNNIVVDARPIARIENTTATGRTFGSGTLIDVDGTRGIVITCAHLFRDGIGRVTVTFPAVPAVEGHVLKVDAAADLAAVAISAPPLKAVEIAERYPERGEQVVSCGYGSDGRLFCNRGRVLGYVVTVGSRGRETLELSGAARQGDSGGPVLNEHGLLVGVLFGTNGHVVDATYCGRVRTFLSGLSPRFSGRAGEQTEEHAQPPADAERGNPDVPGSLGALPPRLRRPQQPRREDPNGAGPQPLDRAAGAAESAARSWLSAKATAVLISIGMPGGLAGIAGGMLVWLAMRRGKRRLQTQLDALRDRHANQDTPLSASSPAPGVVERHHNRYVPYEASSVDRAWAAAHARVTERYPGAVPYLKLVEGVKDQLLSGTDEPQILG